MSQPVDRMRWREAIMSQLGPTNPLARIVLIAVSMPMNASGTSAWEAQTTIATRAHVGLRTVKRHLEIAERHGWVERTKVKVAGRKWYRTEYAACVPDAVYDQLPEKPWIEDPTWRRSSASETGPRRGATVAPDGSNALRNEVPTTTRRGANGAKGGANGDIDEVPSCGLLIRNLNPPINPPKEGALACTGVANAIGKTKTQEEEKREREERIRKHIEAFPHYENDVIAKLSRTSVPEVEWVKTHF